VDLATASIVVAVIGLLGSLAVSTLVFIKSSKTDKKVGETQTEIMTVEMRLRIDLAKCEYECNGYRNRVEIAENKIIMLEKILEKLSHD
jgi:5-bromo-4-chloroindolyl phosphate hydrolysis protein